MPASGSQAGQKANADTFPVTLDTMDQLARQIGFSGRYQMNVPTKPNVVYTFSRDSMSIDSTNPMADRTVHVDRYTGTFRPAAPPMPKNMPLWQGAALTGLASPLHSARSMPQ